VNRSIPVGQRRRPWTRTHTTHSHQQSIEQRHPTTMDHEDDVVNDVKAPITNYKEVGICCFLLKYGICEPPRPPCRFRHPPSFNKDDGVAPCCFGPTCRFGHAKRVQENIGRTLEEKREYWQQYNPTTADNHSPAVRNATLLQSQLEPWSTAVLRERLALEFQQDHKALDLLGRAEIMTRLLQHYQPRLPRNEIRVQGAPVRPDLCADLLTELQAWRQRHGAVNTRPSIQAQSYMILRSPREFGQKEGNRATLAAKKIQQNKRLWDLAQMALEEVDAEYADNFSALAITYGFQGSPHIDKQNTGPFYGLALGEFEGGGICVEVDAFTVAQVSTKDCLCKVDGRYPHWVAPYEGGRYSLIYYSTWQQYEPPSMPYFGEVVEVY
jgi:hypothetical protein